MADLTSVAVSPNSVPLGGSYTVTVGVATDPGSAGRPITITASVDGETGTGTVLVGARSAETVEYSTNPARAGEPGVCVVTVSEGSVSHTGNGVFAGVAPTS